LSGVYHDLGEAVRTEKDAAEKAVSLDPESPAAHNMVGLLYAHDNQPLMAVHEFKEVLRLDPNYVKAWGNIAGQALNLQQPEQSPGYAQQALLRSPNDPSAFIGCCYSGMGYYMLGRFEEAKHDAQRGLALNPRDVFNRLLLIAAPDAAGEANESMAAARDFQATFPGVTIQQLREREKGRPIWRVDNPRIGELFDRAYAMLAKIGVQEAASD
jgi:tetratricopeptide (TPR) repeat protein